MATCVFYPKWHLSVPVGGSSIVELKEFPSGRGIGFEAFAAFRGHSWLWIKELADRLAMPPVSEKFWI